MAGTNGGARPGAGRKSQSTIAYQKRMVHLVQKTVTENVWQAIVVKATEQAKEGDGVARAWLTPWVLGAAPKAVDNEAATGENVKGDL